MQKSSIIKKLIVSLIIVTISLIFKANSVEATVGISWSMLTSSGNHYYCVQHNWQFYNKTYQFTKGSTKTITTGDSNYHDRVLAWILSNNSYYGSSASNKTGTQKALWHWIKVDLSNASSSLQKWFPSSEDGGQGSNDTYKNAASKAKKKVTYSSSSSVIATSSKSISVSTETYGQSTSVKITSLSGSVSKVVVIMENVEDGTQKQVTLSGTNTKVSGWIELYSDSSLEKALKVSSISTGKFYIKNVNADYKIKTVKITATSSASGYRISMTKYTHGTAQNLIKVSVEEGSSSKQTVTLSAEYSEGSLKLVKKGSYYEGTTEKTEGVNATFKVYCSTLGKWVQENEDSDGESYITYVGSSSDWSTASDFESGYTINGLVAGYNYRVVEVEVNDSYYDDIKMISATSSDGTEIDISTYHGYPITSKVKIANDTTITLTMTDTRTSGNIELYKKEYNSQSAVSGVQVKIYYSSTNGGSGGWLIQNNDGTYSYDGVLSEDDVYDEETTEVIEETEEKLDVEEQENDDEDIEEITEDEDENEIEIGNVSANVYYENTTTEENTNVTSEEEEDSDDGDGVNTESLTTATTFTTDKNGKIKLSCVRAGYYYFYEVGTPDEVSLEDQPGYKNASGKDPYTFSVDNNWAFLGATTLNYGNVSGTSNTVKVTYNQYEKASVEIVKSDEITGAELEGAKFKIYAVLNNGTEGWITGDANGTKSLVDKASGASEYSASTEITDLRYGTYYVYETQAPTTNENYVLADQEGYMQTTDSSGKELPGVSTFNSSAEWAYKGSTTLNSSDSGKTISLKVTNRPEGSLQIGETGDDDEKTGKVDSITGEALTGAEFKIYAELETTGIDGVSSGWVSGETNDGTLKQYVSYSSASTYTSGETISRLRYGTYYIYETKAPNDNYDLRDQDNYHATSDEDGEAKGYEDFADDEEWVYVGQVTINFNVVKQETTTGYTLNVPFETETVENNQKGKLQIEKVDQEYEVLKLKGAEFVIYAELTSEDIENGWVNGDASAVKEYSSDYSNATVYTTDENGLTKEIEKLNYGTYYIYEIKTPDGYDITKQDNYLTAPNGAVTPDTDDWVYAGTVKINVETLTTLYNNSIANGGEEYVIPAAVITKGNLKAVNELEGLVWVDKPDTKGNTENYLYKENDADQKDEDLGDIEVRLYLQDDNGNYYVAATTYTEEDGRYTFNFDPDADNYCGTEVTYWQLVTAYVAFVYNNEEYIAVDPFVTATNGMDITINSKAQESEMEAEELEDENLLDGIPEEDEEEEEQGSKNPGLAVTYQGGTVGNGTVEELNEILSNNETVVSGQSTTEILEKTPLTGYYEEDSYKISNINLGLLAKNDPSYSITEVLAYAYLTINGYNYTYYYDEIGKVADNIDEIPASVQKQLNNYSYQNPSRVDVDVSVYSSDVVSTFKAGTSNMKLYLVYGIYVYNSETLTTDDVYYEQNLYLTSLTNEYDSNRMKLSTDNTGTENIGADQFGLWSEIEGTETVTYKLDGENSSFSSGIGAGKTEKTYVQFQVTETALTALIESPETISEWNQDPASTVKSSGFHEYRRTDNLWNQTEDAESRWYNGHKEDKYKYTNSESEEITDNSGDPYYIHKSETIYRDSGALYVALKLNDEEVDERTISGVVYEDEAEPETDDEGNIVYDDDGNAVTTGVGNGIIDENEKNRASGVEVTLLKVSATNNNDGTVEIETDADTGDIILDTAELYPVEITYDENGVSGEVAVVYNTDEDGNIIYDDEGNPTYQEAKTTTDEKGEYTFEGVIPGYYYIQYTYGNGTQKIVDADGNEVEDLTSNDYRSTIINTTDAGETIKNAIDTEDLDTLLDKLGLEEGKTYTYAEILEKYYKGELDETTAQVLLEWYKYLSESIDFNTAVDDISENSARKTMNEYEYTSVGVYKVTEDEDGDGEDERELIATYYTDDEGNIKLRGINNENDFPLNVTAETPLISISIENDNETSTEVYDETGLIRTDVHSASFEGFNLGLIKQETEMEIEKVITKASITLQQGSTVFSGNPATESSTYASDLETLVVRNNITGSKYIRVELDGDLIYGSSVEVEYTVTITNNSAESYDTDEWFKYGIAGSDDEKSSVTVNEIVDLLDEKYSITKLLNNDDGTEGTISQLYITSDGTVEEVDEITIKTESMYDEVTAYYNGTESDAYSYYDALEIERDEDTASKNDVYFTGFQEEMTTGESIQFSYSVSGYINSNDDTAYTNDVELTSLSLSDVKALNSNFVWPSDDTTVVVTPETGGNMSNTYWIIGAIALLVVAGGVVILKKKVLK